MLYRLALGECSMCKAGLAVLQLLLLVTPATEAAQCFASTAIIYIYIYGRRLESDVVVPVGGPQSTSELILRGGGAQT